MSLSSIAARRQLYQAARPVTQVMEHRVGQHRVGQHSVLELVGATVMVFVFVVAAILA